MRVHRLITYRQRYFTKEISWKFICGIVKFMPQENAERPKMYFFTVVSLGNQARAVLLETAKRQPNPSGGTGSYRTQAAGRETTSGQVKSSQVKTSQVVVRLRNRVAIIPTLSLTRAMAI